MCTSQFLTQTRNSWNPVMNTKNLQHPAVLVSQGKAGLAMTPPAPTPASPQTAYGAADPGIAAAHAALAGGRGMSSTAGYGSPSYAGPSLLG